MAKSTQHDGGALNTLAPDTNIKGDLECASDIRFDGTLTGNLICKGKVVLGQSAVIIGKVQCQIADISGKVEGEVIASDLASLKKTAKIYGDLTIGKLAVEPGALFTGNCKTGGADSKNESAAKKK